jgi:integrase
VEPDRDRIVIRLLFGTGCRVEELASTKLEDDDTVKKGVPHSCRPYKDPPILDVIVLESMIPELEGWVKSLPEGSVWLFPGLDPSKHISQRWIRVVIARQRSRLEFSVLTIRRGMDERGHSQPP